MTANFESWVRENENKLITNLEHRITTFNDRIKRRSYVSNELKKLEKHSKNILIFYMTKKI